MAVDAHCLQKQLVCPVIVPSRNGQLLFLRKRKEAYIKNLKMENNIVIRKISVRTLGQLMIDLFERGVNFVDIHGSLGEERDTLGISFTKDYMDEKAIDNFNEMVNPENNNAGSDKINLNLDEDLNQIL